MRGTCELEALRLPASRCWHHCCQHCRESIVPASATLPASRSRAKRWSMVRRAVLCCAVRCRCRRRARSSHKRSCCCWRRPSTCTRASFRVLRGMRARRSQRPRSRRRLNLTTRSSVAQPFGPASRGRRESPSPTRRACAARAVSRRSAARTCCGRAASSTLSGQARRPPRSAKFIFDDLVTLVIIFYYHCHDDFEFLVILVRWTCFFVQMRLQRIVFSFCFVFNPAIYIGLCDNLFIIIRGLLPSGQQLLQPSSSLVAARLLGEGSGSRSSSRPSGPRVAPQIA